MSSDNSIPGLIKTYFWMVHYDFSPVAETQSEDGLTPIPAGRRKGTVVINRNLAGSHVIDFNMPRERESMPDPATFRGASVLRNRIIGFYASSEEANAHLNSKLWKELQEKCGAVYAELHSMKLDLAEAKPEIVKLVA
jgi:hypothetical protein